MTWRRIQTDAFRVQDGGQQQAGGEGPAVPAPGATTSLSKVGDLGPQRCVAKTESRCGFLRGPGPLSLTPEEESPQPKGSERQKHAGPRRQAGAR